MKKAKSKNYTKDILEQITIKEDLDNNKKNKQKNEVKKIKQVIKEETKQLKWWEKELNADDFIIKEKNGKWFGHYLLWNKKIWIGPYKNEIEVQNVIKDYVQESKKPIGDRKQKNIHSIILNI